MYYCEVCGKFFDEPSTTIVTDQNSYGFDPPEREDLCPYCGSDYFREAEYCNRCENWVARLDVDHELCPRCMEDLGLSDEEDDDAQEP